MPKEESKNDDQVVGVAVGIVKPPSSPRKSSSRKSKGRHSKSHRKEDGKSNVDTLKSRERHSTSRRDRDEKHKSRRTSKAGVPGVQHVSASDAASPSRSKERRKQKEAATIPRLSTSILSASDDSSKSDDDRSKSRRHPDRDEKHKYRKTSSKTATRGAQSVSSRDAATSRKEREYRKDGKGDNSKRRERRSTRATAPGASSVSNNGEEDITKRKQRRSTRPGAPGAVSSTQSKHSKDVSSVSPVINEETEIDVAPDTEITITATKVEEEDDDDDVEKQKQIDHHRRVQQQTEAAREAKQREEERIAEEEAAKMKKKQKRRNGIICLVILLLIGGGVAASLVLNGGSDDGGNSGGELTTNQDKESDAPLANDESASPSFDPTTSVPSSSPTESFKYDPPSDEQCQRIASGLTLLGEEDMQERNIDVLLDVTLSDTTSNPADVLPELQDRFERLVVPDLIGCPRIKNGAQRRLESIRYTIAKAGVTVGLGEDLSCADTFGSCVVFVANLSLLIRGDEQFLDLLPIISGVSPIDGDLSVSLELSSAIVTMILQTVESNDPTRPPSSAPSLGASLSPSSSPTMTVSNNPTFAPVLGPPTTEPTKNPTKSPSPMLTETVTAGPEPTAQPSPPPTAASTPTPPPTVAPQPGVTPSPTVTESRNPTKSPSSFPSRSPSKVPSLEPSGAPSSPAPSKSPTVGPTSGPTLRPTSSPTSGPTLEPSSVPSSQPTSSYIGCFQDTDDRANRVMDILTSKQEDYEGCRTICTEIGYPYSAMQNNNCWCGNQYDTLGPSTGCDHTCGSPPMPCGGGPSKSNSVYRIPEPSGSPAPVWDSDSLYCGCTADDSQSRDLEHEAPFEGLSQIGCISYCKAKGYDFAGLQNEKECWCGNSPGSHGISNQCEKDSNHDQKADTPCMTGGGGCVGYAEGKIYSCVCGASEANSLFRTHKGVTCPTANIISNYWATATQSSTHETNGAWKAIDGNTDGLWGNGSLSNTNFQTSAWWRVEFGFSAKVTKVTVYNRETLSDRLYGLVVRLLDENGNTIDGTKETITIGENGSNNPISQSFTYSQSNVWGVQIKRPSSLGNNRLHLAEVQVEGIAYK